MMIIAKTVSTLRLDAQKMQPRGFNRDEIYFNNGKEANLLIDSLILQNAGISAFVPRQKVEKKGLLRGISKEISMEELVELSSSPCKITYAKRMNRRHVNPDTKESSWIPSETVLLTFEGSIIPEKIQVFGLLIKNIEPYIERVRTCHNCGGYGHTATKCRRPPICLKCGQENKEEHNCTPSECCLHCRGNHQTFHPECQTITFNKEVNKILAYNDVSIYETLAQAREKLGLNRQGIPKPSTPAPLNITKFPSLPATTPAKEYTLRTIGGIQKVNNNNQWNNNTLKTYSKTNTNIGSTSSINSMTSETIQQEATTSPTRTTPNLSTNKTNSTFTAKTLASTNTNREAPQPPNNTPKTKSTSNKPQPRNTITTSLVNKMEK
ncbi:hypothetical protein ANTPLA_LOCUS7970 [Anthophora plagiata]